MSKEKGKSFWEDIKDSAKKPFKSRKKKSKKPSTEKEGASSSSGEVAFRVGDAGPSKQGHHDQGPEQGGVSSTGGDVITCEVGAAGESKQSPHDQGAASRITSSHEKTNYSRLCCLLVSVGSQVLRDTFDGIIPPTDLQHFLKRHPAHSKIQSLRKEGILNTMQWSKLYPAVPSSVTSKGFDPALLMILLRTFCNLSPPPAGWDAPPLSVEMSRESDIARVKYFMNAVSNHAMEASVSDAVFSNYWQQIRDSLVRLGGAGYEDVIDEMKNQEMDPLDEEHFIELLKQWKKIEDDIKDRLTEVESVLQCSESEGFLDPTEVINGIRQLYTIREGWHAPFPWCEDFHFHIDDIFTRFEVVSRKKTRGTATSNIVKMSAIFQPHEECAEPRTVLIEGRPGMGKTTYCNKVAYDWATKKSEAGDYLPEIKVVLLLKCRDIDSDLWEAIYDQLLSRDIDEKERENFVEFIRHNQSNVLLVLDGLDELPASKLPEFSEIIQGRMLSRCRFVVTARHEAGIAVRKDFDTLLEIEGFTAQDAEDFISKFFKEKEGKLDQKLIDKLTNDKGLQELTASPLNTALLCLLCEDFQGVFPESRTHLYVEIVQCVLRRYRKKKGLAVNFEDLIEVYKTELKHLGKVALNGLHEDSMYFTDKQLGNHTRDLPGFGFLSVESGSSKRKPGTRYGFLHKSFQEFFAAYYLCCQLLSGEISPEGLATDTRYFHQLRQVLLFTFGMLARQSEETAAALIKSITIQVNEDAENGYAVALDWITECKKEQSDFHLNLARTFGSLLRREFFCFTRQGHVQAAVLAEALQTNTTLTDLSLSSNRLDAAVAAALANALQVNTTLTQLNLSCGNLGAAGADALANALLTNTTLTQLYLSCGNLGAAGADALANALLTNTTLTQLYWSCGNLGAAGADALANSLLTNTTLTHLNLPSDNLGAAGAAALANVLQTNTTLTELNLSKNNLGAAGAVELANALRTNTTLTWLDLSNNNLFAAGAVALANALWTNTTLTELNLSNNNLGAVPADPATVLKRLITTLPSSYFSSNNLSAAGAAAAVDPLQPSETLPELSLFGNNLCAAGAAASVNARQLSATLPGSYLPSSHPFPFGAAYFAAMAAAFQDNTEASALFEALNINTTLSNLYLSKSDFSQSVLKDLKKAHGHRISVVGPFKFF